MKKSELVKLIKEEIQGFSPQIGKTNGLTPDTMSNILTKVAKSDNPIDKVTFDVPLFIRLLEYAKEDAQTDMDLHNVAERAIELSNSQSQPLSMKDYDTLVKGVNEAKKKKKGLWDNIRAKRERGEKPARKGSKKYKLAVKAGKKINKKINEDKSDAIRWANNLKYYYEKGLYSPDLKDPADKEEYKRLAKAFFERL